MAEDGYEARDIRPRTIALVLAGLFGLVLLSLGAVSLLLWRDGSAADQRATCLAVPEAAPAPAPRLSVSPRVERARYLAEQATRQPRIGEAMDRLAATGGWPGEPR
jgi:hypothetical protein